VDLALRRLEDGTYGTCRACGEPIEAARLAEHPTAITCGRHPQLQEQDREPVAEG
jgi:RNA polymerase-binding transcription factor DksA